MPDVSLTPGYGSLAPACVNSSSAPSHPYGSRTFQPFTSQFRGPFIYNETEEERKKREEDEEKRSNFQKVKERAEREEAARKAAEAERDQLLQEKKEREEAERKAAEAKLSEEKKFEELARQKEEEAKAKAAEAEEARKRAESAESRLKEIETQQEAELTALLEEIPEAKRPPLDPSDPVAKRLSQVKWVKSQLVPETKGPVGAGARSTDKTKADRLKELVKKPRRTDAERQEMLALDKELKG